MGHIGHQLTPKDVRLLQSGHLLKNSFYHPIECGPEPINFITIPLRNEILRMQLERL